MAFGSFPLLALTLLSVNPLAPGDHMRSLAIGDQARSYSVHVPPSYDPGRPTPVVLALHAAAMNGAAMARFCGLNETADRSGFVVVYPNGTGSTPFFLYWDAGGVRGRPSDDVGYVAKLLDDLATVVHVDPRRVYATGMSNGAMMCYRLAAELSDRIAAIAPVAGTMAIETCRPRRPVPVLHFHGTKDGLVLFGGPDERIPKNLKFLSVDASIRAWAEADGCPETPEVFEVPDLAEDGTRVLRKSYGPGRGRFRGDPVHHRRGRPHLAGPGAARPLPRQEHEGHRGQRPDLGVLPEACLEVSTGGAGRSPPWVSRRRGVREIITDDPSRPRRPGGERPGPRLAPEVSGGGPLAAPSCVAEAEYPQPDAAQGERRGLRYGELRLAMRGTGIRRHGMSRLRVGPFPVERDARLA